MTILLLLLLSGVAFGGTGASLLRAKVSPRLAGDVSQPVVTTNYYGASVLFSFTPPTDQTDLYVLAQGTASGSYSQFYLSSDLTDAWPVTLTNSAQGANYFALARIAVDPVTRRLGMSKWSNEVIVTNRLALAVTSAIPGTVISTATNLLGSWSPWTTNGGVFVWQPEAARYWRGRDLRLSRTNVLNFQ